MVVIDVGSRGSLTPQNIQTKTSNLVTMMKSSKQGVGSTNHKLIKVSDIKLPFDSQRISFTTVFGKSPSANDEDLYILGGRNAGDTKFTQIVCGNNGSDIAIRDFKYNKMVNYKHASLNSLTGVTSARGVISFLVTNPIATNIIAN